MSKSDFEAIRRSVEALHGCEASYLTSEHVRESVGDRVVWDGMVSVFGLAGHPATTMCYAWSAEEKESSERAYYAVLQIPPIESARDAVRASLALKRRDLPNRL
jgi:hypothetical protein